MAVSQINRSRYHSLVGLAALADQHRARLDEIERAALSLLCVPDDANDPEAERIMNCIRYGEMTVQQLLDKLEVKVTADEDKRDAI